MGPLSSTLILPRDVRPDSARRLPTPLALTTVSAWRWRTEKTPQSIVPASQISLVLVASSSMNVLLLPVRMEVNALTITPLLPSSLACVPMGLRARPAGKKCQPVPPLLVSTMLGVWGLRVGRLNVSAHLVSLASSVSRTSMTVQETRARTVVLAPTTSTASRVPALPNSQAPSATPLSSSARQTHVPMEGCAWRVKVASRVCVHQDSQAPSALRTSTSALSSSLV